MGRIRIEIKFNKIRKFPKKSRIIEGLEHYDFGGRVVKYRENKSAGVCDIEYRISKRPPKRELHARMASSVGMRRAKFDKCWSVEMRDA